MSAQGLQSLQCVIHIAQLEHWEKSFHILISALKESTLYDNLEKIHLIVTSPSQMYSSPYFNSEKIIVYRAGHSAQYERPALLFAQTLSDAKILYLHTKGERWFETSSEQNVRDWIDLMLHWNVYKWKDAVKALDQYDTYGCNFVATPKHYSGNFWWATSAHLQTLPKSIGGDHNDPKYWIHTNPKGKYFSAFQSGLEGMGHYNSPFPEFRKHRVKSLESHGLDPSQIVIMNGHIGDHKFAARCKESVQAYAKLHKYSFFGANQSDFPGDTKKSYQFHYWRSYIIQEAAAKFPLAKWFLWLDSDIYVNNKTKDTKLEDLVDLNPEMLYYTTHERPMGIDLVNTGFKLVNRNALEFEKIIWECRENKPIHTCEQYVLWKKIFPLIYGKFCILPTEKLNCIIKHFRNNSQVLENGLFMHMCSIYQEDRDVLIEDAIAKNQVYLGPAGPEPARLQETT
jgi:hypothetical protein